MQRSILRSQPSTGWMVLVMVCLFATPLKADDWIWNPFSKSSSKSSSSPLYRNSSTSKSKSSWLPQWSWPKSGRNGPNVTTYSRSNTSTWSKMTKTSKQWWDKTTEMLDPYPDPKPSKYSSYPSDKKKDGWFDGWFKRDDSKKIETVPDFLRQESPKL